MKTNLNHLVKENLIKAKQNKEKQLIKERKLIKKKTPPMLATFFL